MDEVYFSDEDLENISDDEWVDNYIKKEKEFDIFYKENIKYINSLIKGSAFITGQQELYISKDDPFPQGYRLNDTWPQTSK